MSMSWGLTLSVGIETSHANLRNQCHLGVHAKKLHAKVHANYNAKVQSKKLHAKVHTKVTMQKYMQKITCKSSCKYYNAKVHAKNYMQKFMQCKSTCSASLAAVASCTNLASLYSNCYWSDYYPLSLYHWTELVVIHYEKRSEFTFWNDCPCGVLVLW